jgi:carboxymethylenebutenolidase
VVVSREYVDVPVGDRRRRTFVAAPRAEGPHPGIVFYSDIFQLTESTLRTARQLAALGFVVAVPEIYPRTDLAGKALEFDDAGKADGLRGAAETTTAQFDSDRVAVLDHLQQRAGVGELFAAGFCIGGHLAFRAALDGRVAATVCFYPTGLQNGALGADDPGSLARAAEVHGRLMVIFGSRDPHVPADARVSTIQALYAAGLQDLEVHVYRGGEHAFMRDIGARHDPELTDLALAEAVSFLRNRN